MIKIGTKVEERADSVIQTGAQVKLLSQGHCLSPVRGLRYKVRVPPESREPECVFPKGWEGSAVHSDSRESRARINLEA